MHLIGILGTLAWFRCRNCGWEKSRKAEPLDRAEYDVLTTGIDTDEDEPMPFDFDEACNPENGEPEPTFAAPRATDPETGEPDPDPGDNDWSEP
jgi:hypothetical protein